MSVHYQRHGDIGVIQIANPPVNALGQAVRSGLVNALKEGIADADAKALVVLADGRTFIAGADIREFGKPPQAPLLPDVITHLEACPKPLIAALHGTALGGGLEVALGCHYRIALAGTRVGLPEVKLGLLPGAGGTQRLPRLVGVERALEMITSGRFVEAEEALEAGIIDAISNAQTPLEAGLAAAQEVLAGAQTPRITGQLPAPTANPQAITKTLEHLNQQSSELFSPFRIVEAIQACVEAESLEAGLRRERELFLACMDSPQRAGLIHLFFAARSPHLVPDIEKTSAFKHVALVGEHPLFERLQKAAQKAGISLTSASHEATELCLLAPNATQDSLANYPVVALEEIGIDSDTALSLIIAENGQIGELVNVSAEPLTQQRVALTLKALRLNIVVSQQKSILRSMHAAIQQASASEKQSALEQASINIAEQSFCYRESDIDLLAVEAFGYPRHLGGPHRQATLSTVAKDV
ncbi:MULTISPECIES: enoyl-CoA hydratase/isomerase family protein [Halomonadaceae]|jgi:3-hydroxyacyl-CoA dehydrogenase|uniref:enoyl-CoA hydratase/isomerase family protein n=1 Tax=Halomonadaceae TaxID=28256 RepID=UPI00110EE308|nr:MULTISPECIES: enoyl-CoA hydratase/isomerase family protein [Halomonas]TMU14840.1 enoyl-CoA hydratase/isomerase family protein [Halomonas sp. ATBC28]CAD5257732.1 Enoyl-CoA hydratase/isomerase family protein [Halomonas sp. 156]CAD5291438.1 Enoyl-CoA hydratase/isomerase family protein [Halomonas sp. 113]CAD5292742.1 Enoyl-CoA hydratase/isomerase family protein [Halomonas sp. 59]CAD5296379.1 Enoyl-CoA hydratase/isomerase family protein [Halomonas sp. I3]